jgi:HlyD family secretion protein
MQIQQRSLFRKKSLERLSSPEQLDRLIQVASPKSWLILSCSGCFILLALIWSILGRLPIAVAGQGVLTHPGQVVDFQAIASGQLTSLQIKVGDVVRKGQVIGTIAQPELEKQLQLQRAKLAELQAQNQDAGSLQIQRTQLEQQSLELQRQNLQRRIQEAEALTPLLQSKSNESLQEQRQSLQQRFHQAQALAPVLQDRLEGRKKLQVVGAISRYVLLEAEQAYLNGIQQIADLKAQLKELDVKQVEAEKSARDNRTQIADLRGQLQQLNNQKTQLAQQNLEASNTRKNQIQEVKQAIAKLELQLTNDSRIVSKYNGRILELSASVGQVISPGGRIASLEVGSDSKLTALLYFPVKDGKRLQPGMTLQITPDTVKREQFGGIVGRIKHVSAYPITQQGAKSQVGNDELVQRLVAQGPQIEVLAELDRDSATFSGYHWSSSQGPQLKMTSGTTAAARVTVEERSPITFVFPILRSVTGIY